MEGGTGKEIPVILRDTESVAHSTGHVGHHPEWPADPWAQMTLILWMATQGP